MQLTFEARRAAFESDADADTLGILGEDELGSEHYLVLQCPPVLEEYELSLEVDDEESVGINCVEECLLESQMLKLTIDPEDEDLGYLTEIVVRLVLGNNAMKELRRGLREVFRGMPERLTLD